MTKEKLRGPRLMSFGEVLTILRNRQSLTVNELAELVGWPAVQIRAIEDGAILDLPTKADALKLAKALDVDPKLLTVAVQK